MVRTDKGRGVGQRITGIIPMSGCSVIGMRVSPARRRASGVCDRRSPQAFRCSVTGSGYGTTKSSVIVGHMLRWPFGNRDGKRSTNTTSHQRHDLLSAATGVWICRPPTAAAQPGIGPLRHAPHRTASSGQPAVPVPTADAPDTSATDEIRGSAHRANRQRRSSCDHVMTI